MKHPCRPAAGTQNDENGVENLPSRLKLRDIDRKVGGQ
jgi:hypothetical protein